MNARRLRQRVLGSPVGQTFRTMIFQRMVPNLEKLGLLTPRVRKAFTDRAIIRFEDFDRDEADRRLGFA